MKNKSLACIGVLAGLIFLARGSFAAEQWSSVIADGKVTDKSAMGEDKKTTMEERLQQTISVEYKDADIGNVLRSLAWTYKINLLTAPDLKGKVTINLQEITVEKALESILRANGLVYNKKDGVIYVSAGDPNVVEVTTDVVQLKYTTATQAQNMAKKILSTKGDIKINEAANNMIVTDYPANIEKIKDLIKKVDTPPRQVLIEAKIVDISSSDLKSLGVAWGADYKPINGGLFDRGTHAAEELKGSANLGALNAPLPVGQLALTALTFKNLSINATIDALVRDGKSHILASPSIAVINGQEARIVIGERFPYKERTQTTSGTTETTKFVDIGTSLKVNPQINDDGYITLTIHPEVSSLLQSLDAGPRITTREADTTVRIKEGETLVIGGLISQSNETTKDKVPGVGGVPILGRLFRRDTMDKEQKELAVFITPRLLLSRDETAALAHSDPNALTTKTFIDTTANLTAAERIFERANGMNYGEDIVSAHKDEKFLKAQALSHYELLYGQFPDDIRAPESMYQAGMIYWNFYKDARKAKAIFEKLISTYPRSPFSDKAKKIYKEIDQKLSEVWKTAEKEVKR